MLVFALLEVKTVTRFSPERSSGWTQIRRTCGQHKASI